MTGIHPNERNCGTCQYWSELVAASDNGQLKALCLAPTGQNKDTMTAKETCCDQFVYGTPIDAPAF